MALDDDDHRLLANRFEELARAVQDPWDRDSLAKDIFLRWTSCLRLHDSDNETQLDGTRAEGENAARAAIVLADVFVAALRTHKKGAV